MTQVENPTFDNTIRYPKQMEVLDYTSDVTVDETWGQSAQFALRDTLLVLQHTLGLSKPQRRNEVRRQVKKSSEKIHDKAREAMQVQQQGVQEQFRKDFIKDEPAFQNDDDKIEESEETERDVSGKKEQESKKTSVPKTNEKDAYAKAKEAFFKK
jgi:hypothetical protein